MLLTVREGNVQKKKAPSRCGRKKAAEHLQLMETLEQQAEAQRKSVRALVLKRAKAQVGAARIKRRDARELAQLQRQQNRIAADPAQAGAGPGRQEQQVARPADLRGGYLMHPVNGPVTSPYGYRVHPIYGYYSLHDGVDFGAGCGQPMYAAADGRVSQRYYSSVWGNRMVVDNGYARGVGLGTIYNHATSYTVGVGPEGPARPGHRVRRHHRLVDRLPPPLHGDGQRTRGQPDALVLAPTVAKSDCPS